jgi:DNA-binding GntR family transcriptional regulator
LDLTLQPGERLSEAEIAERYQVSRQPVREAFISLMRTGLVRIEPQRGTTVVKLSVRRMLEARFIREAVEIAVVKKAAQSFDPHFGRTANLLLEEQSDAAAANDHLLFRRLDSLFHATLAEGADCAFAWRAIEHEKAHMDRVCTLTLHSPEVMQRLVAQHRSILAAINEKRPADAAEVMSLHLTEILDQVTGVELKHTEWFE